MQYIYIYLSDLLNNTEITIYEQPNKIVDFNYFIDAYLEAKKEIEENFKSNERVIYVRSHDFDNYYFITHVLNMLNDRAVNKQLYYDVVTLILQNKQKHFDMTDISKTLSHVISEDKDCSHYDYYCKKILEYEFIEDAYSFYYISKYSDFCKYIKTELSNTQQNQRIEARKINNLYYTFILNQINNLQNCNYYPCGTAITECPFLSNKYRNDLMHKYFHAYYQHNTVYNKKTVQIADLILYSSENLNNIYDISIYKECQDIASINNNGSLEKKINKFLQKQYAQIIENFPGQERTQLLPIK